MTKISRKEQALQTEQNIIDATIQLLKTHSFQDLQIKQICQQAQTSIGNFYHHFPNKHSIIICLLDDYYALFQHKVCQIIAIKSSDKLILIFQEFCNIIELLGSELVLELFVYNIISEDNFLLDVNRPLYQEIYSVFSSLEQENKLKNEESAVEATRNVIIFFRGFLYEWCLSKGSFALSIEITKQVKRYLTLLIKPVFR